ncbi:MAG TPA: hypothetical protein VNH64_04485 [Parvularculaceae bacterium]|nr:hypothetical protein [Parvularculaceae bacterium]
MTGETVSIVVPNWRMKWARMETWTGLEAALLLTGEDPDFMGRPADLEIVRGKIRDKHANSDRFHIFCARFNRRRFSGGWDERRPPLEWIDAAIEKGLLPPEDFCRLVRKEQDNAEKLLAAGDVDPRERSSLLKIVLAMAVAKYGYQGPTARQRIAAAIRQDMEKMLRAPVSEQTIQAKLKQAWREFGHEVEDRTVNSK